MSKKRLQIPLAVHWLSEADFENTSGIALPDLNDGFVTIKKKRQQAPCLYAFTDSPQRVLVVPELEGKDAKKCKSCCGKRCSKCQIPLRSSATIGHFVQKRISKSLKKDKQAKPFFGRRLEKALEELSIQTFTATSDTFRKSKQHSKQSALAVS